MLAVVASAPGYQLAGQDLADTCRRVRAWQVLAAAPTNWPPEAAGSPFVHELRDMGLLVDQTR